MNINYNDGLTREQRMESTNALNKVLDTNIKTVNGNIKIINDASSIDVRTPYATTITATKTGQLNTLIAANVLTITNDTNAQSALDRVDIVAILGDYADRDYTAITVKVTADRTNILAAVGVEIAALITAGTPPTADKQDEMKRVALGYPNAFDASAAEALYYDDNVKSLLEFPDAASVLAARTSYTIKRKNTGLGFPFLVNILGGHNLPRCTANLAVDAIDTIGVDYGGIGYTYAPDVVIVGGSGSGALATANLAYRIVGVTITNPGNGYRSLRSVGIVGGGGSDARILAELYNGKLHKLSVISGGSGYITVPTIQIINGNNSLGHGATATVTLGNGYVHTITVDNGGSGFTSVPSIEFTNNSFEGRIEGILDGTGKVTNLEITNTGGNYSFTPLIVLHPNGTGSGASASVTLRNGLLDTVTLLTAGTAYNSNEITVANTETLYDDYQLRVAFAHPNALDATEAESKYTDQAYRNEYGFPNAKDMAAAVLDYFNMQLGAQLVDPSLISLTQAQQNQIYKNNFGYSSAASVNAAQSSYRIQTMKDLLDGIDIAKPHFDPVKKGRMTVGSSNHLHKTPIPERKEDQVQELDKKNKSMEVIFLGVDRKTKKTQINIVNGLDATITKTVNDEISEIYNQNSFYQRDLVVALQYTNETEGVATDVIDAYGALVLATTVTATSEANTMYNDAETVGDAKGAEIISHNTILITAERDELISNVDNNVDGIVDNRNVYQQQINSKEDVITNKADEIKNKVKKDIAAYGTNNPPSQGIQDQMYKDGYGYPAAGSVADARQSYIDNNLKKELGFPNDTIGDAKTKYIDLGIKTQLGYPDVADVASAAVLAKVLRKKKILGYPSATDVSTAEASYLDSGLCKALDYPQEVIKITITNKGKGYKTPPLVVFSDGGTDSTKIEAYSVLNKFGEVGEIIITNNGTKISITPTIILAGGGGEEATAIVSNDIPTGNVQAQAFYTSQYINNQFGFPADGIDVTEVEGKYVTDAIMQVLGYGGGDDLEETRLLYTDREYQRLLGYPDSNPNKTKRYILETEAKTKIYGVPTDFLNRYSVVKYPNVTNNNAAELMWYYTKMNYYLVNALPGKTLEYMNQIYKGDFGYPAKALALATLTGGGTIDSITVTNPLENSGYAQTIPTHIYIDNVLTPATVTVANGGRITAISVTSSTVYADPPTITVIRSFDLVDTEGNPVSDSVVYGGSDYKVNPTIVLKGGAGTGAVFTTSVVDEKLVKVNVMMGGSYTELPDIEVVSASGDYGRNAKVNIILNDQGKIETYIPVSDAQDAYTTKRIGEVSTTKYDLFIKSTLINAKQRSMNLVDSTMTHDERVYGRKPLPTPTTRNAMILRSGYAANLSNPTQNKSMSISNSRPLMTRQIRLSQASNYTTLYRQAELYVKFKIIEGANATSPTIYTPEEQNALLYARLALIKGGPRPKQKPTINPNIGNPFGTIDNTGTSSRESTTHKERVAENQTRAEIQKSIDLIIADIEKDNGGKAIPIITNVVVPSPSPGYTIVGVVTNITLVDAGQNFKYTPRVRIISPTGIEAFAEATLNPDKTLASINATNGGLGYLTANTTVQLLISAQERSELTEKYWWSIVREDE